MHRPPLDPWSLLRSVLAHQELILRLTTREVTRRFQDSLFGLAGMVLTPRLTSAVFTFLLAGVTRRDLSGSFAEARAQRNRRNLPA